METTQHNLRHDRATDSLVPVGAPAVISTRCWHGLAVFPAGDGFTTEFCFDGTILGAAYYPTGERPPEPLEAGDLKFIPRGAISTSGGGFLIVGDNADRALVRPDETGRFGIVATSESFPECCFELTASKSLAAPLDSVGLRGSYRSASATLTVADASALRDTVARAYGSLSASAAASGVFVQPVFVRYTIYDAHSNILFRSQPRLMPCGDTGSGLSTLNFVIDAAGASTLPSSMQLPGYTLALRIPSTPASAGFYTRAARLAIEATPQIHRPDFSLPLSTRLSSTAGGNVSIVADLPGTGLPDAAYARKMTGVVERGDSLFREVASVTSPFEPGSDGSLVEIAPLRLSFKEEEALVARAVGSPPVAAVPPALARCSCPHSVVASVTATSGSQLVMANPVASLFDGHSLCFYLDENGAIDYVETVAIVKFADGRSQVVSYRYYRGAFPKSVSPFYSYPDPTATSVDFYAMTPQGKTYTASLPLTPAGAMAYHLSPGLVPVPMLPAPDGVEFNIPPAVANIVSFPGTLLSGNNSLPFSPRELASLEGRILTIDPAPRVASYSQGSASERFIVAGTAGIFSVGLDASGRFTRPVTLDRRPVLSNRAVASVTAPGHATSLMYLAAGDLVEVTSGSVRTILRSVASMEAWLAWCASYGELCIIEPGSTTCKVYTPGATDAATLPTRSLPDVDDVLNCGAETRLTSASAGYMDLGREVPGFVRCTLATDFAVGSQRSRHDGERVRAVVADISSSSASGTLEVAASEGSRYMVVYSRLDFSGSIFAPVIHRVMMPRVYIGRLRLDGIYSSDTLFRSLAPVIR